jgi:hypothetical protein
MTSDILPFVKYDRGLTECQGADGPLLQRVTLA